MLEWLIIIGALVLFSWICAINITINFVPTVVFQLVISPTWWQSWSSNQILF